MNKRAKFAVVLVLILCPLILCAQLIDHPKLDSLKNSLEKCTSDENKIPVLLNIANAYIVKPGEFTSDLDSGIWFANRAAQLNKPVGNTEYTGLYYFVYAKDYHERKNIPVAENMGRRAVGIFVKGNYFEEAADVLKEMSYFYPSDIDSERNISIKLCSDAVEYYQKAKALQKQSFAYERLGDLYYEGNDYRKSIDVLKEALSINQRIPLNNLQGIYRLLGQATGDSGNYEDAIKYLFLSLKTTENAADSNNTAVAVYNQIGRMYYDLEDWSDAEINFKKAFDIANKINQIEYIQTLINNIVNSLNKMHLFKESLAFQSSVENKYYYPESDIYNRMAPSIARCYTYIAMGQPELMEPYAKKLLPLINNIPVAESYTEAYKVLVRYYIFKSNLKMAQKYLDILKNIQTVTSGIRTNLQLQYLIDSASNNYKKALESFKKYTEFKDKVSNEKTVNQLARMKIQYQTAKKDQEIILNQKNIELLSREDKINKLNLKNATLFKNIMIAGAGLLIVLLILSFSRYRLKIRSNKQLQSQQAEIYQQNIQLQNVITEKDKLLVEKEWLVKEIHHRVKNNLQIMISLLRMQTSYLDDGKAIHAIGESRHRLQAISLLHQKLYHAEQLDLVNMEAYIKDLITYLKDSFDGLNNLKFDVDVEAVKLQVSHAIPIGLIINEAVTNAVKYAFPHGRKGNITISLQTEKQTISLYIKDNGIGLNINVLEDEVKSMGMRLIQILAEQIGGTLKVSSMNGMCIEINKIPCEDFFHSTHLNEPPLSLSNLA